MCGIVGIFAYNDSAPPADRDELRRIRDHMADRGPDGKGEWSSHDGRVALGHRRLSIIDLSDRASQPMASADGKLVVTFNGEIYNYRELRAKLEAQGRVFRSDSDTEVLLHLYAIKGETMVEDLRGMFAFALWDETRKNLLLARDPFGIKPLYLADNGGTLRFASQVQALLRSGSIDTGDEPAGHVGFFLWGHVPEPYTLYRGIRALPAGSLLRMDAAGAHEHQYFHLPQFLGIGTGNSAGTQQLHDALRDSVRAHLVADVPVGVFLSAGIDSTTLAALASEVHPRVQTVTLGFPEYRGTAQDETPLAEAVARQYGTRHQTVWIDREDFAEHADRLLAAMDQPSIDGVNSYFVSVAAVRAGLKVCLSGLGGDELFAGYPSFSQIPRLVGTLGRIPLITAAGPVLRRLTSPLWARLSSPKYAGVLEYGGSYAGAYLLRRALFMPWELPSLLDPEMVREGLARLATLERLDATAAPIQDPSLRVAALELGWYMRNQLLRDTDWASMAHSLEVRVPLIDVRVASAVRAAPSGVRRKAVLARAPQGALPEAVTARRKTGFTVPVRDWMLSAAFGGRPQANRGLRGWAQYVHARKAGAAGVPPASERAA